MSAFRTLLLAGAFSTIINAFPPHDWRPSHSHPGPGFNWNETKHIIAFGDSYTYVQGALGYPNSTFIGSMLDLAFTPSQLLTNPIIQNQTGTAEGGPNWVEYLTGCGLRPGETLPLSCGRQLWDFAFGGSDIEQTTYTPLHHNWTVPLVDQVRQFETYAQPVLEHIVDPEGSLVIFWIGINDISDSAKYAITHNVTIDFPSFYNQIISAEFEAVQKVHALGYDNFLFLNLPPLNLVPGSAINPTLKQISQWDATLSTHIDAFNAANEKTGGNAMLFDANTFLNSVQQNAASYGIVDAVGYCRSYNQPFINEDPGMYGCLPLQEYFWFNNGHLTSRVHEILAVEVERFLERRSARGAGSKGGWRW